MGKITANWDRFWLALIVVAAASIRAFMVMDWKGGAISFAVPCDLTFLDEIKPLVESTNLLHFEVFFYPPVAPFIVAFFFLPISALTPGMMDLGIFCRYLTIAIDLGTLALIYLVGKEWSGKAGLMAAAFYGVTMIAIVSTGNPQAYSTFFVMLAFYWLCRSLRNQSGVNLVLMGASLGLAVSAKYFPAFLFLMLFVVHFMARQSALSTGRDKTVLPEHPQTGRSRLAGLVWSGTLYGILFTTMGAIYLGLSDREGVLDAFRAIYDGHPHEHAFEYHMPAINRLYQLGLASTGGLGVLVGAALVLPYWKGISPWVWIRDCYRRNWLWLLPCVSMAGTVFIALGIPAVLNLNNYLKYLVFTAKAYASTDGGRFPAARPAPSYLLSFFPENLGLVLFALACLGIVYGLLAKDRRAMLIVGVSIPLYIMLELSSVKVNRYALELMPLLCLFAGVFLARIWEGQSKTLSVATALVIFLSVSVYSATYALAWANVYRPGRDVRVETAEWVKSHVPKGSTLGITSGLILSGASQLMPAAGELSGYDVKDYQAYPEYIVLPKLLYDVMVQYLELKQAGYTYTDQDWFPYPPPTQGDLAVMGDIVTQKEYRLVEKFEKTPSVLGFTFPSQTFGRHTWFLEHVGPYGIQIYQKRAK